MKERHSNKEREQPVHIQTVIMPSELKELKDITGEYTTKTAVSKAVIFTIENMKKN